MPRPSARRLAARAAFVRVPAARWLALVALLGVTGTIARAEEARPPLDPKLRADLIKGGRNYLNPAEDADPFSGRLMVRGVIEKSAQAGIDFLGRLDLLRDLAYQGRGFLPDYLDKRWQKSQENTEVKEGKHSVNVSQGDKLRLAFSVPKKDYIDANLTKVPRIDPFPTLVTLIEEKDYAKPWPGDETIGRRYGTVPAFKEVMEKWILFAPVAVRGKYVEEKDGQKVVKQIFFGDQLKNFYQRYHVDFERMVLDGEANSALTIAAVNPFSFAGILVRKPLTGAVDVDRDLVCNYATVPVFVLGDDALAATLKEAGHPNVTKGGDAEAMAWLKALPRRTTARSFTWNVKSGQHTLAHWLILNPDWSAAKRTLDVKVVDTKEEPNTILIEAKGMIDFSALLNDEIVPLAREVRIVVNGKQVAKQRFERTLEQTFEHLPVKAKDSMYYALLFPAVTARIFPPPPAVTPAPGGKPGPEPAPGVKPGPAPAGASEADTKAEELLKKAQEALAGGNTEAAKKYYEAIVAKYPDSPSAPKAKEALASMPK